MNPLLNKALVSAVLTAAAAVASYYHLIPAGAAEAYVGPAAVIIGALATGNYALAYRTAVAAASGASVDSNGPSV